MLKRLATIVVLFSLLMVWAVPVSAHLYGQPPFFLINGQYSNLYPVPLTSLSNFPLPQDLAPSNYLINQSLDFKFDLARLPAPPDVVKKTQFTWDFGDGSKDTGLSETHTYTKIGSYIIVINAYDGTTPSPQIIESVLVNILPNKNYQLPKPVIKVNGRQSKDPLTDILDFQLGQSLRFDGSSSTSDPNSKIISYFWDFGDQKSSNKTVDDHYYPKDLSQMFPVLRVRDSNGFFGDNFVEVENALNAQKGPLGGVSNKSAPVTARGAQTKSQLPEVLGIILILGIGVYIFKRIGKRGR